MKININKARFNIILGVAVITLSLLTISWQHQNYRLYKESKKLEKINHQLLAMHKQLLAEQSQALSGAEIKEKALKVLKMHPPKKPRELLL